MRGIHRWPVNSPHKGPVTRKMFPFDDVIMNTYDIPTRKHYTTKPCAYFIDDTVYSLHKQHIGWEISTQSQPDTWFLVIRTRPETTKAGDVWWYHYDVIKWKHFPRYWPIVPGIHRSPVNSPHKGQWRGALMFSLIGAWTNGWVHDRDAGDLRLRRAHYDVTVMMPVFM